MTVSSYLYNIIDLQFMILNISFKQTSIAIISNLTNRKLNSFASVASRFLKPF